MSRETPGVVIIGAGLAGLRCATTLRSLGYVDPITLIGDETDEPYERPALSKQYLAGTRTREELALASTAALEESRITLERGAAVASIDPVRSTVTCADGRSTPYRHLVFATGASPRRLPGSEQFTNVVTLRTRADADHLRMLCQPGRRLVIVGCGFVGAEVASTVSRMGVEVVILESAAVPYEPLLGEDVGAVMLKHYLGAGVEVRTSSVVDHIAGDGTHARRVVLQDGAELTCNAVLESIGVAPRDELFWSMTGAPLPEPVRGGGICVDASGRTAVPGIYACGDVAAPWRESEGMHRRIEHWTDAAAQGVAVAHAIAGRSAPDQPVPYVWSDQFGLRLQFAGVSREAASVDAEELDPAQMLVRYRDSEGHTVGVLGANRPRDVSRIRQELSRR